MPGSPDFAVASFVAENRFLPFDRLFRTMLQLD
ncbi:hypothetical protein L286_14090 [Sphingobium sp. HDIP04]|nr:hypothetical protein L286_14090 [Sphingobium sp. HDIP04]